MLAGLNIILGVNLWNISSLIRSQGQANDKKQHTGSEKDDGELVGARTTPSCSHFPS